MHSFIHALSRRELFRGGGVAGLLGFGGRAEGSPARRIEIGRRIYESIGVRPVINCRGTLTIISGSLTLPEVKRAMDQASRHYVHIDELMEAVGDRLALLTGAEFGLVTSGCAAALTHLTATCVAGADPELIQRLPDTSEMKNEVVCPVWSRNVYDHAVRMVGVKMVNAPDRGSFARSFNPRTAMVMVMAGPQDSGPFGLDYICQVARQHSVPVVVDAAAEDLTIPNVHLARGATVVLYSGGKIIRGPQCAGLALGSKELLKAAWINCSPHHTFGRPMKVGKEEIVGMLVAVEAWTRRDRDAEMREQSRWLEGVARSVRSVKGVTAEVRPANPKDLSNRGPRLHISWDPDTLGVTAGEIERLLYETEPRIDMGMSNYGREPAAGRLTIAAQMMMPGEAKVVAERLRAALAGPRRSSREAPNRATADVSGSWSVRIEFLRGSAGHRMELEQSAGAVSGSYRTRRLEGKIVGRVLGDSVRLRSSVRYEGTRLEYVFSGQYSGNRLSGECNLGEYGKARWSAERV